ncbi:hypothetical protein [Nonomuraea dietziae]|uniref:hypothetical protein n=1 Tax=Nonomuraea dietziae TaxID=65515 RepID=UPI003411C905
MQTELIGVMAAAAVVLALVYLSSYRHPLKQCWRCKGKGILRSGLLPWRYRICPQCGRKGEVRGPFGRK